MKKTVLFLIIMLLTASCSTNGQNQSQQNANGNSSRKNNDGNQSRQLGNSSQNGQQGAKSSSPDAAASPGSAGLTSPGSRGDATQNYAEPDLAGGNERDVRAPHPLTLSDLNHKYSSTFLLSGSGTKRQVALTFDDAPDATFTPQVLDMLKKYDVKATFFVMGNRAEAHPELVRRMVKEGHIVGNHSYNHPNLPKLKDSAFREQILRTDRVIHEITGYTPKLVRPPYGNINENQINWLASQDKKIIGWNVDSLDWKGLSAEQVSTNILAHVHPGSIILQHAAGGKGEDLTGTIQALPKVIEKLHADGVRLVTLPELLGVSK